MTHDARRSPPPVKGRGAISNPHVRFESAQRVAEDDGWSAPGVKDEFDADVKPVRTEVLIDSSRSAISYNRSPDLPFDRSVNPYRGCEHGCIYCYARPSHAYLGFSPGLDFETRLLMKPNVHELLAREVDHPDYRCQPMALGTNTDPYQPLERHHQLTRRVLEVLSARNHPVTVTTKSTLVERDLDLLAEMASRRLACVAISLPTIDDDLSRKLEPRAAAPGRRLKTVQRLSDAGVPVSVFVAPVIPVLSDTGLEDVLEAAREGGAVAANYILLRLPGEVVTLFDEWLSVHYPLKRDHVLSMVRQHREGELNDVRFGHRMRGAGLFSQLLSDRFQRACARLGLSRSLPSLDITSYRGGGASGGAQLSLF
jgi:DNA repair photolyase